MECIRKSFRYHLLHSRAGAAFSEKTGVDTCDAYRWTGIITAGAIPKAEPC